MSKTSEKTPGFFAVRKGAGYLRNAIFLNWEDCHVHVFRGVPGAEYAVFETVQDAVKYLSQPKIPPHQAGDQLVAAKRKEPPSIVAAVATTPASSSNKRARTVTREVVSDKKKTSGSKTRKPPRPSPIWETMFDRVKQLLEGNMEETDQDLERWIADQRKGYHNMQEDKKALLAMTAAKAERLKEIGFDFQFYTWDDRLLQLQDFEKEHGKDKVDDLAERDSELAKWYAKQKTQYRAFCKGKPSKLDAPQIHKLKAIGFGADNSKYDEEFTEMFEELREYKRKHGHCNVHTQSKETIRLSKWVIKQRCHYKQLKDGKSSHMNAERMIKLTDLGFVFVPKGKNPSWDDRIAECRKFYTEHKNIRFPKSEQAMRSWISRVRGEYRLFKENKPCNITQEKIDTLNEMGIVWETGFASGPMRYPRKSWDERFEDMLSFIRVNGHSVVPQATPGLGEWVHTQRVEYKKLQHGKKSAMTAERALKLVTIGFTFDAQKKRGKQSEVYDDSYT